MHKIINKLPAIVSFAFLACMGFTLCGEDNALQASPDGQKPQKSCRTEQTAQKTEKSEKGSGDKERSELLNKFIAQVSPEELDKFKKLQKDNPEAFREEIRKKLESHKSEQQDNNVKMNELVEKYRKSQTDEEKNKLKDELKSVVKQDFDKKMESSKQRLEHVEKQLKEFRSKYEDRQKNADQIIDSRINDLIKDPKQKL